MRVTEHGGVSVLAEMVRRLGLLNEIDASLNLLATHQPYRESTHVLAIALNIAAEGRCLQDAQRQREDKALLATLGVDRLPAASTSGDFLRRFTSPDVIKLEEAVNRVRVEVWNAFLPQPQRELGIIDGDGSTAETDGECKEGTDFTYNKKFGYHPLLISLANTREPLYLVNRPGNRPSHDNAAAYYDRAIAVVRQSFRKVLLRGDTDFSQSAHLDRWHDDGIQFLFGFDARKNLCDLADGLEASAWRTLHRPPKYEVQTIPRGKRKNVKEEVVERRKYRTIKTVGEEVAEFLYRPVACSRMYRMVVLRKRLEEWEGKQRMLDKVRYFFYITNCSDSASEIVLLANKRCNQENLIEQLKNGVHAMKMPLGTLVANNAHMVCAALAWTLKAWLALLAPSESHRDRLLRMKFATFVREMIRVPCQIVRTARHLIQRIVKPTHWTELLLAIINRIRRINPASA